MTGKGLKKFGGLNLLPQHSSAQGKCHSQQCFPSEMNSTRNTWLCCNFPPIWQELPKVEAGLELNTSIKFHNCRMVNELGNQVSCGVTNKVFTAREVLELSQLTKCLFFSLSFPQIKFSLKSMYSHGNSLLQQNAIEMPFSAGNALLVYY